MAVIILTVRPSTLGVWGYHLRARSCTTYEKFTETLLFHPVTCGARRCQCPGEHTCLQAGPLHTDRPGAPLSGQHCQKALRQPLKVSISTPLEKPNCSTLPKPAQCTQVSSSHCSHHRYADLPLPSLSSGGTYQSRFYSTL